MNNRTTNKTDYYDWNSNSQLSSFFYIFLRNLLFFLYRLYKKGENGREVTIGEKYFTMLQDLDFEMIYVRNIENLFGRNICHYTGFIRNLGL